MPSPDEKNILKILEEEGGELGELHEVKVSRYMGLRLDYIRSILDSMGRRDLVDVFKNGKVNIADKGWRALGKPVPSPLGKIAKSLGIKESKPQSSEDKYKRWMSGEPEEEPKQERSSKEKDESEPFEYDSYADLPPQERLRKLVGK